jgi:catechol 2,3-dioxygenase-like lactoylglutathione lyase family enzyme
MHVTGTHHIALFTSNLDRLRAFYVETLGLPQIGAFQAGGSFLSTSAALPSR